MNFLHHSLVIIYIVIKRSPLQKANIMKIQFEIKETLAGILDQLLHSDFWITEVEEIDDKRKRI